MGTLKNSSHRGDCRGTLNPTFLGEKERAKSAREKERGKQEGREREAKNRPAAARGCFNES